MCNDGPWQPAGCTLFHGHRDLDLDDPYHFYFPELAPVNPVILDGNDGLAMLIKGRPACLLPACCLLYT